MEDVPITINGSSTFPVPKRLQRRPISPTMQANGCAQLADELDNCVKLDDSSRADEVVHRKLRLNRVEVCASWTDFAIEELRHPSGNRDIRPVKLGGRSINGRQCSGGQHPGYASCSESRVE